MLWAVGGSRTVCLVSLCGVGSRCGVYRVDQSRDGARWGVRGDVIRSRGQSAVRLCGVGRARVWRVYGRTTLTGQRAGRRP
eukprot:2471999-Prymnesium_polylepis.1